MSVILDRSETLKRFLPKPPCHVAVELTQPGHLENGERYDRIAIFRSMPDDIKVEGQPIQIISEYFLNGLGDYGVCNYEMHAVLFLDCQPVRYREFHSQWVNGWQSGEYIEHIVSESSTEDVRLAEMKFDQTLALLYECKRTFQLPENHLLKLPAKFQVVSAAR